MMTEVTYTKSSINPVRVPKLLSTKGLLFMYLGIPAVLISVYLLPVTIRAQFFTLYLHDPMLLSLLTNVFNHSTASHLATNLLYYVIILSVIIFVEKKPARFFYTIIGLLVLVPIFSSVATLAYFSQSGYIQLVGFSGVVSGMIGYLIFLLLERMYQVTPQTGVMAPFMFISLATLIIFSTAVGVGLVSIYQAGHLSNGIAHLVGYSIGLLLPYTFRKDMGGVM